MIFVVCHSNHESCCLYSSPHIQDCDFFCLIYVVHLLYENNSATALANDGLIDDAVPLYLHVSVLISLLLCRYFGNTFC